MARKDFYRTDEEIEKEYKRLAKRADNRLRRLEGYKNEPGYENVLKWAYANAQHDIQGLGKHNRFDFKIKNMHRKDKIAALNAVTRFLAAPTSTKSGITSLYKDRVDTINKEYGTNFTWQEFATFIDKNAMDRLSELLGSGTTFKTIGKIGIIRIKEMIEDANNQVKREDLTTEEQKKYDELHNYIDKLQGNEKKFYDEIIKDIDYYRSVFND